MKDNAKILKFKGKELTPEDVIAAQSALMEDIISGAVSVAESRPVQKELTARMKEFETILKVAKTQGALKSLVSKRRP